MCGHLPCQKRITRKLSWCSCSTLRELSFDPAILAGLWRDSVGVQNERYESSDVFGGREGFFVLSPLHPLGHEPFVRGIDRFLKVPIRRQLRTPPNYARMRIAVVAPICSYSH